MTSTKIQCTKSEWKKTDFGKSAQHVHKMHKDAVKEYKQIKKTMEKLESQLLRLAGVLSAMGNFSKVAAGN